MAWALRNFAFLELVAMLAAKDDKVIRKAELPANGEQQGEQQVAVDGEVQRQLMTHAQLH